MLKWIISYPTIGTKFQNTEFQEDASLLGKQMNYALPKALSAAPEIVILNNEPRKGSSGTWS